MFDGARHLVDRFSWVTDWKSLETPGLTSGFDFRNRVERWRVKCTCLTNVTRSNWPCSRINYTLWWVWISFFFIPPSFTTPSFPFTYLSFYISLENWLKLARGYESKSFKFFIERAHIPCFRQLGVTYRYTLCFLDSSRELSARGFALHSVCPQRSFFHLLIPDDFLSSLIDQIFVMKCGFEHRLNVFSRILIFWTAMKDRFSLPWISWRRWYISICLTRPVPTTRWRWIMYYTCPWSPDSLWICTR